MARGVLEVPLPPRRGMASGAIPVAGRPPRRRCPGLPVALAVASALLVAGTALGYLLARLLT